MLSGHRKGKGKLGEDPFILFACWIFLLWKNILDCAEMGWMGPGWLEKECEVGGRPESKLARCSWRGVLSPGVVAPLPNGNLLSVNRAGQPPLLCTEEKEASSSGRFTPESFQKFR